MAIMARAESNVVSNNCQKKLPATWTFVCRGDRRRARWVYETVAKIWWASC